MTTAASESWRRLPYLARLVRARPRLFTALAVGVITEALLPSHWQPATRLLTAWDIAIALYLMLVYEHIARAKIDTIRHHAAIEDEGQYGILVLNSTATPTRAPADWIFPATTHPNTGTSSTSRSSSA